MRTHGTIRCGLLLACAGALAGCSFPTSGATGGPDAGAPPDADPACAGVDVDDDNPCTNDRCVAGEPVHDPRAPGATCPGGVCDGDGACVECVGERDCTGGEVCDPSGLCVPPTCTDDQQNGDETDLNCGGDDCAPCGEGDACEVATDCESGICDGDHVCTAPRCGDGVQQAGEACDDGNETNDDGCDDGNGGNCTETACGNGVVAGDEACDDGNATLGDGCDDGPDGNCTDTACGNGVVTANEACDDGNDVDGDCCDACAIVPADHEPNSTIADADDHAPITGSIQIEGSITNVSDELDVWRLDLAADSTVRLETFSAGHDCVGLFDSTLRLYDAAGAQLLTDDDRGIAFCSALVAPLAAGTYYLSLEEYQMDGSLPAYVLEVQVQSDEGAETEPNDTRGTADTNLEVSTDAHVAGDHPADDLDYFAITVPSGQGLRLEVVEATYDDGGAFACTDAALDPDLTVFNAAGAELAYDDKDGRGDCPLLDGTGANPLDPALRNTTGVDRTYYVRVDGNANNDVFAYRLAATVR